MSHPMGNTREERLTNLYRKVLYRDPEPEAFRSYLRLINRKPKQIAYVESILKDSFEYRKLVLPAVAEIRKAFELYHLKTPDEGEIAVVLSRFRSNCGGDREGLRVIEQCRISSYLDIRPINVEMDVTNACNLRCIMCYFRTPAVNGRPKTDMPLELFERIAEQIFPGASRVCLSFATEPLMHHDFAALVECAMAYRIPKLYINTNGTMLSERLSEKLVRCGFSAVNISMDAASKETFERVRKGARFDTVINNVKTLNRIKEELGSSLPKLGFSFVMMRRNIHEVPDFIRLAHRWKVEDVHLMHLVPYQGLNMEMESLVHHKRRCNRMLAEARKLAEGFGIHLCEPGDFPMGEEPDSSMKEEKVLERRFDLLLSPEDETRNCCPFPWHFVGIPPSGHVQPCGFWFSDDLMGNLLEHSFEEIWKGKGFQELRAGLREGRRSLSCQRCPSCGMGPVGNPASFSVQNPF